ncbi:hemolysin family protein [Siccirubricoccus sp. G192]|nr:hemolysin family protein [Siccirubricoccus sp. G192]
MLNGVFALSELAVISARRAKLRAMAEADRPGARSALALADDPGRFLSTVQIGISLVSILAGAFSGPALGGQLAARFADLGVSRAIAEPLGFGLVVALVTYLSIVIGELVPKRLALRDPEGLACRVAPLMTGISRVAAPLVWLLDASGNLIFRLLRLGDQPEETMTDEDLRALVIEAEQDGTIETAERRMIAGVLRLGDRPVKGVMTPRAQVDWIDAAMSEQDVREVLLRTARSRLPVADGSPDAMIGVVQSRTLLAAMLQGERIDARRMARSAPVVPDTADALDVLDTLREVEVPMALVLDEYGHFEGIVTPADLTAAIVGTFRSDAEAGAEPVAVQREDGSWLIVGWMPADEMAERLGLTLPPGRSYQTAAGFVLQAMGHLPRAGEAVEAQGWRFEVVDLDGRRIDKVLAAPVRPDAVLASRRPGAGPVPRTITEPAQTAARGPPPPAGRA